MKPIEILKKIVESADCKTKVIATHKVTEPQKKLWQEFETLNTKAKDIEAKAQTAKKKFWNKVEADLNDFDHNIRIDTDRWVLEVHEDDCENCGLAE